jgi:hypothetical protein
MRKPLINKKTLISLFIVFVMVLSTFGFILSYQTGGGQREEYNGHKLTITDQGTMVKLDGKKIYFSNFPTQLEDINMSSELKDALKNAKMLTITYNPGEEWAEAMADVQYQAEQSLPEYTEIYVARGVTNAKDFNYTLPEFTCKNATSGAPVLNLQEGNETELVLKNNCIIASAKSENDFYRMYERILYAILGIME